MMKSAGIDIGSRTVKLVITENSKIIHSKVLYNSHNPLEICKTILKGVEYDSIVATGYGRHLFKEYHDCTVISEISAVASGARFLDLQCNAILDIGGQDTKVISLDNNGKIQKFEMNDKCAAGTGRFLEIMASALSFSMEDFISEAGNASEIQKINSMCTVFAESEVISLVARGVDRKNLALGIHSAIANRAVSMLKRVPLRNKLLMCGGVALNSCMVKLVGERLGMHVTIPDQPQVVAALGCALSST